MPEQTSRKTTSLELDEYDVAELKEKIDITEDVVDTMGTAIGRALERINCLETLDSLAFIREDISYVRMAIGDANSTRYNANNAIRRMKEVLNGAAADD